ncbi:hypothetical protein BD324DRAFT_631918 [Kockovaella imperatae]|uniref:Uncharacterized protein n=1 Tax=Kockovaella imperatae TaxID=4999 RepID=A0A1Y1UB17_9TREE|nr:hypothetical protein BD324DRAFT_631918 [Kockovaella imperatae]ORX35231.1 hypothetical protein BD324DRAFT_631918 [Kockovaella imperatae]
MPIATNVLSEHSKAKVQPLCGRPDYASITRNLLALSQDVTALAALSYEATASLAHDIYQRLLSRIGLSQALVKCEEIPRSKTQPEGARGLAVVVLGSSHAGQTLTLMLAKSGYTVFPLVPLPSPDSPPTSTPLSSLLLKWSSVQKRLKVKDPNHPGAVVPLIMDPLSDSDALRQHSEGRYVHAGETIRAYCRENRLILVAVVCAASSAPATNSYDRSRHVAQVQAFGNEGSPNLSDVFTSPPYLSPRLLPEDKPSLQQLYQQDLHADNRPHPSFHPDDEHHLFTFYRSTVLEPLAVVRELRDQLSSTGDLSRSNGRVIFINEGHAGSYKGCGLVNRVIDAARSEAARWLREQMRFEGIDVCEVKTGPLAPRLKTKGGYHLRHSSDESTESAGGQKLQWIEKDGVHSDVGTAAQGMDGQSPEAIYNSRLALISRFWAVDDALLFSAVRRAIEDRHPRYRHHAGISPILASIGEVTPGSGLVKMLGRWILSRLLMPKAGRRSSSV